MLLSVSLRTVQTGVIWLIRINSRCNGFDINFVVFILRNSITLFLDVEFLRTICWEVNGAGNGMLDFREGVPGV